VVLAYGLLQLPGIVVTTGYRVCVWGGGGRGNGGRCSEPACLMADDLFEQAGSTGISQAGQRVSACQTDRPSGASQINAANLAACTF
jgi:hypothetical protein